jgi:hypothetical protein
MLVPPALQQNRRATAEAVLAAQALAIKAELPITAGSLARFSCSSRTLEAKEVLESIYAQIEVLGDRPETKTKKLDWSLLEARLATIISNPEMSLRAGAIYDFPLLGGTRSLSKVLLSEALRRVRSGDTIGGELSYRLFRSFISHDAFQHTLITLLVGISHWKRYADSLARLNQSFLSELGSDLFAPMPPLKMKQILEHEFVFQWDQMSPQGQICELDARALSEEQRSERYIFLTNWTILFPILSQCPTLTKVSNAYLLLFEKLLPFWQVDESRALSMQLDGPRYPLDAVRWNALDESLGDARDKLETLGKR